MKALAFISPLYTMMQEKMPNQPAPEGGEAGSEQENVPKGARRVHESPESVAQEGDPAGAEQEVKKIEGLEDAQTFEQLYDVLEWHGDVEGSQQIYTASELIHLIDAYRSGVPVEDADGNPQHITPEHITRVSGLRDKVEELAEVERRQKEYENVRIEGIDEVRSFNELYDLIDRYGNVRGKKQEYSPGKLKLLIDAYRHNDKVVDSNFDEARVDYDNLPRFGGIREKAAELKKREKEAEPAARESEARPSRGLWGRVRSWFGGK